MGEGGQREKGKRISKYSAFQSNTRKQPTVVQPFITKRKKKGGVGNRGKQGWEVGPWFTAGACWVLGVIQLLL